MVSSDQRRRQLAREKFARQQERRESTRRKARRRNAIIAASLVAVLAASGGAVAAGAFKSDDSERDTDAAPSPSPSAKNPCAQPAAGDVKKLSYKKEPNLTIDKSADYAMKLATTCGDIDIDLKASAAPHTVNSFDFLVNKGYLDHTKCHRLTTQNIYVLQCGDPEGTGAGGPGYTIPDENLNDKSLKGDVYPAGTVAMANQYNPETKQGRDSGGSQFFLVYKDSPLPSDYTPFGTISEAGMKVLGKIAAAGAAAPDPTTGNTAPNASVVIDRASVSKS